MRLTRTLTLGAVVAIVVAVGAPAAHATPARDGLLYLGSGSTITAVSPETGAVQFTKTPAIATRDWSRLYSTQSTNTETVLTTSDARNGKTLATRRLAPNLGVRAVSDNGQAVVLTESVHRCQPVRTRNRVRRRALTVVRVGQKPRTYLVHGQRRARGLLAVDALAVRHRVHAADRARPLPRRPHRPHQPPRTAATPHAVRSNEDELQEPMRGTARAQTMAPDGRRLYTLYTRDATATEPAESFVHVLDLATRTRDVCRPSRRVRRRAPSARSRCRRPAPVSTSWHRPTGALAEIDTAALRITRTAQLPEPSTETTVRATVAGSTTLYVAMAGEVTSVDLTDLAASGEWYVPGTVTGIQPAANSRTLFVSLADRVLAVDPKTGTTQREFVPINAGQIDHVAPALRPIVQEIGSYIQCAC